MSSDSGSRAVLDEVESAQEFAHALGSAGAEAGVTARGAQLRVARSAGGGGGGIYDHWRRIPGREPYTLHRASPDRADTAQDVLQVAFAAGASATLSGSIGLT
jgi:hypothetical protein